MPRHRNRILTLAIIRHGDKWSPPVGWEARILTGFLWHVTATTTYFTIKEKTSGDIYLMIYNIPGHLTTVGYGLLPVGAPTGICTFDIASNIDDIWINSDMYFEVAGASTAYARVIIELQKIDPKTGAHLA